MIEDRVGELRLRVRTDLPDAAQLRPAAEQVVCAALERCAALLEERAPGRLLLIRTLPLHWRLDVSVLEEPDEVAALAQQAADAIERLAHPPSLDPPADRPVAICFEDEAQWRASHLLARARGHPAWFHADLESAGASGPLAALAAPERRALAGLTLLHLARANVLVEVLAGEPAAAVTALAAALGLDGTLPMMRLGSAGGATQPAGLDAVGGLAALAADWPLLPDPARALALRVHAALQLDLDLTAPEVIALATAAGEYTRLVADVEGSASSESAPGIPFEPVPGPAPVPHQGQTGPERPDQAWAAEQSEEVGTLLATRCAGLFYLLDRIQELDLAQSLWQACLPEGAVLGLAAAALLGPGFADDPGAALFGGVPLPSAFPSVTPEQAAEVAIAACSALAAALPRRGLADLPPLRVSLVEQSAGRLLVARAAGSPFAVFAWPAATGSDLTAGFRALLDAWPHRGLIQGTPALATLDTSGRLRPDPDIEPTHVFLPAAPSLPAVALLAVVAGVPCTLLLLRAGGRIPGSVQDFVARYLAVAGQVRLGPDCMELLLDIEDTDPDLRRAGLDRDPGWVPWLKRRVRLVFEERPTAARP